MTSERQLPDGWRWVRFGDVVRQVKQIAKNPESEGLTRIVGLDHLDSESLPLRRWNELADLPDGTSFTRVFRAGQVLFGKRRAYQRKVAVAEFDGVCSGDILVFEPSTDELLPEFLPYLVQSDAFFDHALGTSAGSLSPRTKWQDLAKYKFALPPRSEQRDTVAILDTTRDEGEALDRSLEALGGVSDAVGAAVFGDLDTGCWASLEEICDIPPQNGVTVPKDQRSGPIEMINMGALFREEVLISGTSDATVTLTGKQLERFAVLPGDLLFARRSIVLEGAGRCVMVSSLEGPTVFESSILRVRVDPDKANPEFILRYLHSPPGRLGTSKIVRQGAVAGIAGSDLRELPVPILAMDRQQEIINRWAAMDRVCSALHRKGVAGSQVARALRESLLRGDHV